MKKIIEALRDPGGFFILALTVVLGAAMLCLTGCSGEAGGLLFLLLLGLFFTHIVSKFFDDMPPTA